MGQITTQNVAMALCKNEGLKEQVNIAQMNEIVAKFLPTLFENYSIEEIASWFSKEYLQYFMNRKGAGEAW